MSILSIAECRVGRCAGGVLLRGELFQKSGHFQCFFLTSDLHKTVPPDFFVTLPACIVCCHLLNCSNALRSRFVYFVKRTRIRQPFFCFCFAFFFLIQTIECELVFDFVLKALNFCNRNASTNAHSRDFLQRKSKENRPQKSFIV